MPFSIKHPIKLSAFWIKIIESILENFLGKKIKIITIPYQTNSILFNFYC